MPETINFYGKHLPYPEFSNFWLAKIFVDGKTWPTTEHYFQAMKFEDPDLQEWIRSASTPAEAAKRGRDRSKPLRLDWEDVKDDVMYTALIAKFTQHSYLYEKLMETKDAYLVEHTKNDSYWGDGGDGSGLNKLGTQLVQLRTEFNEGTIGTPTTPLFT